MDSESDFRLRFGFISIYVFLSVRRLTGCLCFSSTLPSSYGVSVHNFHADTYFTHVCLFLTLCACMSVFVSTCLPAYVSTLIVWLTCMFILDTSVHYTPVCLFHCLNFSRWDGEILMMYCYLPAYLLIILSVLLFKLFPSRWEGAVSLTNKHIYIR